MPRLQLIIPVAFAILWAGLPWPQPQVWGQLQTLSKGNADQKWRDLQVAEFDRQLADAKIPKDLKQEIQAQRDWLAKWAPGKAAASDAASAQPTTEAKPTEPLKEPVIDPNERASQLRAALFNSKTGPTVEDTTALQTALAEHSGDLGLRQLQLHWVDQPRYLNDYWKEIGDACGRVISLMEQEKQTAEIKSAIAFTYYRKARALAHALRASRTKNKAVAGVDKLDEEDLKALQDAVGVCAAEINELVGTDRPEFFQLEIFMLRRDQWSGQALQLLEKYATTLETSAYQNERRSLLTALNWKAPAAQATKSLAAIPADQQRVLEIQFAQ